VSVDPTFAFKDLVMNSEGASWSMFGGGGGGDDADVRDSKEVGAASSDGGGRGGAAAGEGEEEEEMETIAGGRRSGGVVDAEVVAVSAEARKAAAAERRAAAAAREEAEELEERRKARARAVRGAEKAKTTTVMDVLGLTEEVLALGRNFTRLGANGMPCKDDNDMSYVDEWQKTRDMFQDDYKRRRRQAVRQQKAQKGEFKTRADETM